MDRLIEYITSFDPAFPSRIEGATADEIERLERTAGAPLPPDYRAYLELMGRRDDSILGSNDILSSADGMADYYEEAHSGEYDGHTTRLYARDPSPRQRPAESLFDALGFDRLWFSDEVTMCYESAEDKIVIHQIAGQRALVQISCRGLFRRWRLARRVSKALDIPLIQMP